MDRIRFGENLKELREEWDKTIPSETPASTLASLLDSEWNPVGLPTSAPMSFYQAIAYRMAADLIDAGVDEELVREALDGVLDNLVANL